MRPRPVERDVLRRRSPADELLHRERERGKDEAFVGERKGDAAEDAVRVRREPDVPRAGGRPEEDFDRQGDRAERLDGPRGNRLPGEGESPELADRALVLVLGLVAQEERDENVSRGGHRPGQRSRRPRPRIASPRSG